MKKFTKIISVVMVLAIAIATFAPAALASEMISAPSGWTNMPQQSTSSYSSRVTKAIQTYMNAAMNQSFAVDGFYNSETAGVVRVYQMLQDLTPDAIVGPNTWSRMYSNMRNYLNSNNETYYFSVRIINDNKYTDMYWFSWEYPTKYWNYYTGGAHGTYNPFATLA